MPIKMPKKPNAASSPEEFISGATAATPSPARPVEFLPWLDPKVRDNLRVQLNAKIPERLMIQRDWLANRLGMKKQDILEIALREWVDARLRELDLPEE